VKNITRISLLAISVAFLIAGCACGGGGGASTNVVPTPAPAGPPQIVTANILPGGIQGRAYSTTLVAQGGQAPLKWSISPLTPTASFVNGLSMDPSTGVLSGTVNFGGTAGFLAQVTDSLNHSVTKGFTVTGFAPLTGAGSTNTQISEFSSVQVPLNISGGVPPLRFRITGGSFAPGLRFDSTNGIVGTPFQSGNYSATVEITDSFTPPEVLTQQVTVNVAGPTLSLRSSLPSRLPANASFTGRAIALGGTPPYSFAVTSGSVPVGMVFDNSTGTLSGIPTQNEVASFQAQVSDSSTPPQTSTNFYQITIDAPRGRNDSPTTATPIANGTFVASLSPYIDPPNKAPLPADNDYYKLISVAGATVHLETFAERASSPATIDTVLEVVDANGARLNNCRQPGDTTTAFNSPCLNDDISASPHVTDSALDLQVPGTPGTATTVFAHVLDWRGSARPDMLYQLNVSGVVSPLSIVNKSVPAAARTLPYATNFIAANAQGAVTWSLAAGALPPGITLGADGTLSGAATTNGTFLFTVKATDSSTPPQTATAQYSIQVADPVVITSPAVWPDACLGQPYSFTVQTVGGIPPIQFSFFSITTWVAINLDTGTGVFSGTPGATGTFIAQVGATDITGKGASQRVTLTVKTCP
jgi:large repetitive protein